MTESLYQESIQLTGLPGATAQSRYAGATVSGYPTSGSFVTGDFIIDQSGTTWVCTSGGSPGTWLNPLNKVTNAVASAYYTSQTAQLGPINLYTAPASGFYQFNYYAKVTSTGTTSTLGPITITSTDIDGTSITNYGDATSANTVASGFINGMIPLLVGSGTTISYTIPYASTGSPMGYEAYVNLSSTNLTQNTSPVVSFNGRAGAVTPANGDYSFTQISGIGTVNTVLTSNGSSVGWSPAGNPGGTIGRNSSGTVGVGELTGIYGSSSITLSLPSSPPTGTINTIVNTGTADATISLNGAINIQLGNLGFVSTSFTLPANAFMQVLYNGPSNLWYCINTNNSLWSVNTVSINENIAGKNFIINGAIDIWQRGNNQIFNITNMSGNGTVITVTATGHNYFSGQVVSSVFANQAGYNLLNATVLSSGTNTFTVSGTQTGSWSSGQSPAYSLAMGSSFVNLSDAYAADQWFGARDSGQNNFYMTKVATGLSQLPFAIRAQRTSGDTQTGAIYVNQSLENNNSYILAGQTVTLSFYARAGANYSATSSLVYARVLYGTTINQRMYHYTTNVSNATTSFTLTTSWQRFTYTVTIPSNITQVGIELQWFPTGTGGAADYVEYTGVQLENNPVATPFTRAGGNYNAELTLCQRYLAVLCPYGNTYQAIGTSLTYNTTSGSQTFFAYQVPLRENASYSVVQSTTSGGWNAQYYNLNTGNQNYQFNTFGANAIGPKSCVMSNVGQSTPTSQNGGVIGWVSPWNLAGGYGWVAISAEL